MSRGKSILDTPDQWGPWQSSSHFLAIVFSPISLCDVVYVCFPLAATQTITLHVDMTRLNLTHAKPCCKRSCLFKYLEMGLTTEEIVEVLLKLSSLESLGIHLKIEGTSYVIYVVFNKYHKMEVQLIYMFPFLHVILLLVGSSRMYSYNYMANSCCSNLVKF